MEAKAEAVALVLDSAKVVSAKDLLPPAINRVTAKSRKVAPSQPCNLQVPRDRCLATVDSQALESSAVPQLQDSSPAMEISNLEVPFLICSLKVPNFEKMGPKFIEIPLFRVLNSICSTIN